MDPSMSVKRKITVPVGRLGTRAASALCQFGPLTRMRFADVRLRSSETRAWKDTWLSETTALFCGLKTLGFRPLAEGVLCPLRDCSEPWRRRPVGKLRGSKDKALTEQERKQR